MEIHHAFCFVRIHFLFLVGSCWKAVPFLANVLLTLYTEWVLAITHKALPHNLHNDFFLCYYFSPLSTSFCFFIQNPLTLFWIESFSDNITRHSILDVAVFNTRIPTETSIEKNKKRKKNNKKTFNIMSQELF